MIGIILNDINYVALSDQQITGAFSTGGLVSRPACGQALKRSPLGSEGPRRRDADRATAAEPRPNEYRRKTVAAFLVRSSFA